MSALAAIMLSYNHDKRNAEQVIAQLSAVKAGVLRYNINDPASTDSLKDLVLPRSETQDHWNGPYVDSATRLTPDGQFDISKTFPNSRLELVMETIDGVVYQAVVLKGLAEEHLKNAILAKCGESCKPLPGRDDIGLLIQQTGVVAQNTTGFDTETVPSVDAPVAPPSPPWTGPPTTVSPTVSIPPITPAVPTPLVVPPSTPSTPVPTPQVPTTNPTPPTPSVPLPFSVPPPITTTETQTLACPVGYSGMRVQSRTKTYTPSTGGVTYTAWSDSTNTCTPPRPPICYQDIIGYETGPTVCGLVRVGWEAVSYSSLYQCQGASGWYSCAPIYQNQCGATQTPIYGPMICY